MSNEIKFYESQELERYDGMVEQYPKASFNKSDFIVCSITYEPLKDEWFFMFKDLNELRKLVTKLQETPTYFTFKNNFHLRTEAIDIIDLLKNNEVYILRNKDKYDGKELSRMIHDLIPLPDKELQDILEPSTLIGQEGHYEDYNEDDDQ